MTYSISFNFFQCWISYKLFSQAWLMAVVWSKRSSFLLKVFSTMTIKKLLALKLSRT